MLCGEEITLTDDRHADVAQHEVGLILQDCNKTLLTVACSADFELPVGQLLSDQRSRFAIVLDAQNSLARLCHAAPRRRMANPLRSSLQRQSSALRPSINCDKSRGTL